MKAGMAGHCGWAGRPEAVKAGAGGQRGRQPGLGPRRFCESCQTAAVDLEGHGEPLKRFEQERNRVQATCEQSGSTDKCIYLLLHP